MEKGPVELGSDEEEGESGVLFSSRCEALAYLRYFVANLRTFWRTFYLPKNVVAQHQNWQISSVPTSSLNNKAQHQCQHQGSSASVKMSAPPGRLIGDTVTEGARPLFESDFAMCKNLRVVIITLAEYWLKRATVTCKKLRTWLTTLSHLEKL